MIWRPICVDGRQHSLLPCASVHGRRRKFDDIRPYAIIIMPIASDHTVSCWLASTRRSIYSVRPAKMRWRHRQKYCHYENAAWRRSTKKATEHRGIIKAVVMKAINEALAVSYRLVECRHNYRPSMMRNANAHQCRLRMARRPGQ